MDADYYLDTIKTVFQDFQLVNGTWQVNNPEGQPELVRPQDITTTALLTVEGELDDISGSGQTEAAHGLCTGIPKGQQQHLEAKGAATMASSPAAAGATWCTGGEGLSLPSTSPLPGAGQERRGDQARPPVRHGCQPGRRQAGQGQDGGEDQPRRARAQEGCPQGHPTQAAGQAGGTQEVSGLP